MGILDDAIREHLELKKAHGANQDEVARQEAEVFGPVRQEVAPVEAPVEAAPEPAAPVAEEETVLLDHPEPVPETDYEVHPGDHPVPDPHREGEPGGADPAWGEDTELFSEPAQAPAPAEHREERHPALHDTDEHFHAEAHPPEPVFGHETQSPAAPEAPIAPPQPVEDDDEPWPEHEEPPAAEGETAEGEEDVLEETPEFLQDAPEHDRLWFEQKPPRDFDFGE